MIINTMLKYNFTADVYVPRIDTNNSQTVYVLYEENTAKRVNIVSSRQTLTMYSEGPIEYGSRVLQVRNPDDRLLFIEGATGSESGQEEYEVYVHAVLPVVDIYGTITGYRSTLRRNLPKLTDIKEMDQ